MTKEATKRTTKRSDAGQENRAIADAGFSRKQIETMYIEGQILSQERYRNIEVAREIAEESFNFARSMSAQMRRERDRTPLLSHPIRRAILAVKIWMADVEASRKEEKLARAKAAEQAVHAGIRKKLKKAKKEKGIDLLAKYATAQGLAMKAAQELGDKATAFTSQKPQLRVVASNDQVRPSREARRSMERPRNFAAGVQMADASSFGQSLGGGLSKMSGLEGLAPSQIVPDGLEDFVAENNVFTSAPLDRLAQYDGGDSKLRAQRDMHQRIVEAMPEGSFAFYENVSSGRPSDRQQSAHQIDTMVINDDGLSLFETKGGQLRFQSGQWMQNGNPINLMKQVGDAQHSVKRSLTRIAETEQGMGHLRDIAKDNVKSVILAPNTKMTDVVEASEQAPPQDLSRMVFQEHLASDEAFRSRLDDILGPEYALNLSEDKETVSRMTREFAPSARHQVEQAFDHFRDSKLAAQLDMPGRR